MTSIYHSLLTKRKTGSKSFAVLLDPDKLDSSSAASIINIGIESKIDYFLVGGSLLTEGSVGAVIKSIKSKTTIPVVLFPGSPLQIHHSADAILFLSLISGRNPEFLIGQHVISAPLLKRSEMEILPTGYILVDCGKQTTVSYMSNTTPIPYDKNSIAACTALAGEMLGLKLIYLDGGSGALNPISKPMIAAVKEECALPLIVGGGINSAQKAYDALVAGADMIVIGNAIERSPDLLVEVSGMVSELNVH